MAEVQKVEKTEEAIYMEGLVARARAAQKIAEGYSQERVDELCEAVSYAACNEEFRRTAAQMLVEESKMGVFEDKFNKIRNKAMGVYRDMKGVKSVGVVSEDKEKGLVTYCKPMGVIGAITPVTNGEATPIVKTLWVLKARDALIISPHRSGKNTAMYVVNYIRKVLKQMGAPEDLVICVDPEKVGRPCAAEMMKQCDFVVATGGSGLVRAAYSSGTPTIGVGAGNDTTYIDDTADLQKAAEYICASQIFDNSSSCSSENNIVANKAIYEDFIKECEKVGAFVARNDSPEKKALVSTIWPDWPESKALSRHTAAKSIKTICDLAGITVPEGTKFIIIEELDGCGEGFVTTTEKLCPVVSLVPADDFEDALVKIEKIADFQGSGHAAGIHTKDMAKADIMGKRLYVARILVNQPQALGNSGAWFNGLPITMSLGCSTWGGNSTSSNVTWRDVCNFTTVSQRVEEVVPTMEDLYSEKVRGMEFTPDK